MYILLGIEMITSSRDLPPKNRLLTLSGVLRGRCSEEYRWKCHLKDPGLPGRRHSEVLTVSCSCQKACLLIMLRNGRVEVEGLELRDESTTIESDIRQGVPMSGYEMVER